MISSPQINLDDFSVSPVYGFLSTELPLQKLPHDYYAPWEQLAPHLPELIRTGQIRGLIDAMPVLTTEWLQTEPEWRRAYSILGYFTHAYVWGGEKPKDVLPPCVAKPFLEIAKHLELTPCATYAGVALWNYTSQLEMDSTEPDHLSVLNSFTGTKDEEWFMVISIAIEAKGARLIQLMLDAISAATLNDASLLTVLLCRFTDAIQDLTRTLKRMYEKNDPQVFFHQLRPFLAGSKNMASAGLPRGVFYDVGDGVGEWHQYSGGSNAQSSLLQTFDIFLGVNHSATGDTSIKPSGTSYIQDMRNYMPAPHRRFLEVLSDVSNVRPYVASTQAESPVKEAYNAAVLALSTFRDVHIQMVSRYIIMPARSKVPTGQGFAINLATASTHNKCLDDTSPNGLFGTGGTNLIPFLKQTRDATKFAMC